MTFSKQLYRARTTIFFSTVYTKKNTNLGTDYSKKTSVGPFDSLTVFIQTSRLRCLRLPAVARASTCMTTSRSNRTKTGRNCYSTCFVCSGCTALLNYTTNVIYDLRLWFKRVLEFIKKIKIKWKNDVNRKNLSHRRPAPFKKHGRVSQVYTPKSVKMSPSRMWCTAAGRYALYRVFLDYTHYLYYMFAVCRRFSVKCDFRRKKIKYQTPEVCFSRTY